MPGSMRLRAPGLRPPTSRQFRMPLLRHALDGTAPASALPQAHLPPELPATERAPDATAARSAARASSQCNVSHEKSNKSGSADTLAACISALAAVPLAGRASILPQPKRRRLQFMAAATATASTVQLHRGENSPVSLPAQPRSSPERPTSASAPALPSTGQAAAAVSAAAASPPPGPQQQMDHTEKVTDNDTDTGSSSTSSTSSSNGSSRRAPSAAAVQAAGCCSCMVLPLPLPPTPFSPAAASPAATTSPASSAPPIPAIAAAINCSKLAAEATAASPPGAVQAGSSLQARAHSSGGLQALTASFIPQ